MPDTSIEDLYNHLKTLTKQWFYDKPEIDELLESKMDEVEVPTKISDLTNDSDFISTSETVGLIKNDGSIDTTSYLTSSDISGKVNRNELSTVATTGNYSDLNGIPQTFTPSTHEHSSADIKDSNAHSNIGTSANANQSAINTAIDTKFGALLNTELVVLEVTLPTASASTMNKIHLIPEADSETNDAYEVYITVENGNNYSWEKLDTARIDLTGYATVDHTHGNISNDGKIGSTANQFVYTTTAGLVTSKSNIGNITIDGAIGSTTGQVVTTTTNGVLIASDWVTEVDNIILQLASYGNTLNYNGETVTINLQVPESKGGFTHGMGLFLFDTETEYADFDDLRANVDYSAFIPLEPNETSIDYTDGFDYQFVFNNVMPGEYCIVLCDYDENNLPLLRQTSNDNLLVYINKNIENVESRYTSQMPYGNNYEYTTIIEVIANETNIWYAKTDY